MQEKILEHFIFQQNTKHTFTKKVKSKSHKLKQDIRASFILFIYFFPDGTVTEGSWLYFYYYYFLS